MEQGYHMLFHGLQNLQYYRGRHHHVLYSLIFVMGFTMGHLFIVKKGQLIVKLHSKYIGFLIFYWIIYMVKFLGDIRDRSFLTVLLSKNFYQISIFLCQFSLNLMRKMEKAVVILKRKKRGGEVACPFTVFVFIGTW